MDHTVVRKRMGLGIAGICISVVAGFMCLIIADRIAGVITSKNGYFLVSKPNQTLVFDTNEFHSEATISAQGIRSPFVSLSKPKSTYRILALGDSFTFGWGVSPEESWISQAGASIKIPDKKIEIINAAYPGMDIQSELEACQAYANRFDVDAVIVGMYITDDLYQVGSRDDKMTMPEKIISALFPTLRRISNRYLMESWGDNESAGARVEVREKWKIAARDYAKTTPEALSLMPEETRSLFLSGEVNPALVVYALQDPNYFTRLLDPPIMSLSLTSLRKRLEAIRHCTGKKPVTIVVMPSFVLVSDSALQYGKKFGFAVDSRLLTFDFDSPIKREAEKIGAHYISVLSDFRRDGCPDCYYPWDRHLTPAGNSRVAQYVISQYK